MTSATSHSAAALAACKTDNAILRVNIELMQEQLQKSFKRIKELREELDASRSGDSERRQSPV